MSLAELLPQVETLSREDKRRLMETLQQDLKDQEMLALFPAGQTIEIWSPHEAHEAAVLLQKALDDDKAQTQ
jgi:hypothetical protein